MQLEEAFLHTLQTVGATHINKMFGWHCAMRNKNFFTGYKILDDSVIILFLVLSDKGYNKAIKSDRFQKFEFGKTWVETELNRQEDIDEILPFIKDAFVHSMTRKEKTLEKKPEYR